MIVRVEKTVRHWDENDKREKNDYFEVYISGQKYYSGLKSCEEEAIQEAFKEKRSLEV